MNGYSMAHVMAIHCVHSEFRWTAYVQDSQLALMNMVAFSFKSWSSLNNA